MNLFKTMKLPSRSNRMMIVIIYKFFSGVSQGSDLIPLLFLIYLYDIGPNIGTPMWRTIRGSTLRNVESLQAHLD